MESLSPNLRRRAGIDRQKVVDALRAVGVEAPSDYLEYMSASNGASGDLGRGFLELWPVEVIFERNADYQMPEGIVAFASNGGDAAYAFDTRTQPTAIIEIPFVSDGDEDIIQLGRTFSDLLDHLKG